MKRILILAGFMLFAFTLVTALPEARGAPNDAVVTTALINFTQDQFTPVVIANDFEVAQPIVFTVTKFASDVFLQELQSDIICISPKKMP